MPKLCEMEGVRGGEDGFPVELWRDEESGRLVVAAYGDAGYSLTTIDLGDILLWVRSSERAQSLLGDVCAPDSSGADVPGDGKSA